MKKLNYFTASIISIIIWIFSIPLGGFLGGHPTKLVFCVIAYTLLTIWFLRRLKNPWIVLIILGIPPLIPVVSDISQGYENFLETKMSWPSALSYYLGIGIGFIYNSLKTKTARLILGFVSAVFVFWVFVYGYSIWLHFVHFDNLDGRLNQPTPEFRLTNELDTYSNCDFNNSVVVLDFWNMSCSGCLNDMPRFNLLSKKIGSKDTLLYSVNIPSKYDSAYAAINFMKKYEFTVPLLYSTPENFDKFGVDLVPIYIVLDKGRMVLRGDIRDVYRYFKVDFE